MRLLWLGVALAMVGCDLGTDVGNGRKPKPDAEEKGNHKEGAESADDPMVDGDSGGSETDEVLDDAVDESTPVSESTNFPVYSVENFLLAGCASPLSEARGTYIAHNDQFIVVSTGSGFEYRRGANKVAFEVLETTTTPFDIEKNPEFSGPTCKTITKGDDQNSVIFNAGGSVLWTTAQGIVLSITVSLPDGRVVEFTRSP